MKISKLKLIKSDERGEVWDCDKLNFVSRKKGSVSGDHIHEANNFEILYLIKGEIELTVDKETQVVKAPAKLKYPVGFITR
jgi:mannose-6-phosphate isomerase-like protein (cupin superfamily)